MHNDDERERVLFRFVRILTSYRDNKKKETVHLQIFGQNKNVCHLCGNIIPYMV